MKKIEKILKLVLTFGGWNAILTKSVGDTDKKPTDKTLMWGLSSAGRASALQAEGHRFEPYRPHILWKTVLKMNMERYLSWLDHEVHTRGVEGSYAPLATYGSVEKSWVLLALWTV